MTRYASVLDLIGQTPIIDVTALSPKANVTILAKLEGRNPAGSVKDRVAVSLVDAAERDGLLIPGKPDQVLVEPSSGNTGIALAMVCRLRGYHLKVVLPSNVSPERRQLLLAWGAEIIDSPGAEGSNGAVRLAQSLSADNPDWTRLRRRDARVKCRSSATATKCSSCFKSTWGLPYVRNEINQKPCTI